MRIYFVGSHATGKTTMTRHVSRTYGLPMITEVARGVLAELEIGFERLRSDIEMVNMYQKRVFERQIEVERLQKGSFVSDRAFDNLAYAAEHTTNLAELMATQEFREIDPDDLIATADDAVGVVGGEQVPHLDIERCGDIRRHAIAGKSVPGVHGVDEVLDRLGEGDWPGGSFPFQLEQAAALQFFDEVVGSKVRIGRVAFNDLNQLVSPGQIIQGALVDDHQPAVRIEGAGDARKHHLPIQPVQALRADDEIVHRRVGDRLGALLVPVDLLATGLGCGDLEHRFGDLHRR